MRMTALMIQPLVLTLMNRKVKANRDYNLSYLITKNKFAMINN